MSFGLFIHNSRSMGVGLDEWLCQYDPDGGNLEIDYPTGMIVTTDDPEQAIQFESFEEAFECWRQVSTRTPTRPDGRPNRPLTAFAVTIEPLPDENDS